MQVKKERINVISKNNIPRSDLAKKIYPEVEWAMTIRVNQNEQIKFLYARTKYVFKVHS